MKDLHSHFLPGVDDGAKSIDSTRRMLLSASSNGVTDVMFTPHYILDSDFSSNYKENLKLFKEIKEIAKEEFGVNVYLGNEVYCNNSIEELLKNKEVITLNNSRYMLIEIPMYNRTNNLKSIFFELLEAGIIPILAHPERYTAYYNDIDFFMDLREMGVLMQANYPSLLGVYGRQPKKMLKKLLKANLISFMGSDIHSASEEKYESLPKLYKKLARIVDEQKLKELTEINFDKVVNNEEI